MFKKFISIIIALMLSISLFCFTGCKNNKSEKYNSNEKIMTLSLNPEVEFILDDNNKVIYMNALNEEGNLIVAIGGFVNKPAEEAVELFIKLSKDTKYIYTGGDNKIEISISGKSEDASKLFKSVSESITDTSVNLTQKTEFTIEQMKSIVKECYGYLDESEINNMDYATLIEKIKKSRNETNNIYSQVLKENYYACKETTMNVEKFTAICNNITDTTTKALMQVANTAYKTASENLVRFRSITYNNIHSEYQTCLKAFQNAKINYLKYRNYVASLEQNEVTEAITTALDNYKQLVDTAETALNNINATMLASFDAQQQALDTAYANIIQILEESNVKIKDYTDEINKAIISKSYINDYKAKYSEVISNNLAGWQNMYFTIRDNY